MHRFFCSAVLSLGVATCGLGQEAPVASNPPEVAVARSAPNPAPNPPPGAPQMVRLQFPNSDVQDVLHLYEQLTGKKLVMDNFVQGKVNIFISKDVPREEAIKIIEINLLMNGYSLVPSDEDIVKVIGTGKNPRTSGVPIISDESEIPTGDHVSAISSSCATPIRPSCSRRSDNIFRRRSLTRLFWHCRNPGPC